jgi:glucose/arabinose dehydrogenase
VNPQSLNDAGKITPQVVVDRLPDDGHHPLKQLLLDNNGNIYLSMGAKTNNCENANGTPPQFPCAESSGARATASIWKITSPLNQPKTTVYARGLRNAMGMTWSAQGELIATENGRDNIHQADRRLSDARLPHDELNVIRAGGDYGWPYCFDNNRASPEYRSHAAVCRQKIAPTGLLPAHSAPLGITRYPNDGSVVALRGRYLIALHGYRDTGHRLIAIGANAAGRPAGKTSDVISAWGRTASQPMGAPVEARVAPSGKIYITDDRNDALLRLSNIR